MSEKTPIVYCQKHRTLTSIRPNDAPKWCCEVAQLEAELVDVRETNRVLLGLKDDCEAENKALKKELRTERRKHLANLLDADGITPEQYEKAVAEIDALIKESEDV